MLMLSKRKGGLLVIEGRYFGALEGGGWPSCASPDPHAVSVQGRVSLCPPLVAGAPRDGGRRADGRRPPAPQRA